MKSVCVREIEGEHDRDLLGDCEVQYGSPPLFPGSSEHAIHSYQIHSFQAARIKRHFRLL